MAAGEHRNTHRGVIRLFSASSSSVHTSWFQPRGQIPHWYFFITQWKLMKPLAANASGMRDLNLYLFDYWSYEISSSADRTSSPLQPVNHSVLYIQWKLLPSDVHKNLKKHNMKDWFSAAQVCAAACPRRPTLSLNPNMENNELDSSCEIDTFEF